MGAFIPCLAYAAGAAALSCLISSCAKNIPPTKKPQKIPKQPPSKADSLYSPPRVKEAQEQGISARKVVSLPGRVVSGGKPVAGATVLLTHIAKGIVKTVATDSNGRFKINDVKPSQYTIVAFSDHHLLDAIDYNPYVISENLLKLIPRPKESTIEVSYKEIVLKEKIVFKRDGNGEITGKISEESDVVLRELAEAILNNPQFMNIEIQGHNGKRDEYPWDEVLSKGRASAVLRRLVRLGVSLFRLRAKGYGFDKPLVRGNSAAAQEKNERIQMIIPQGEP